MSGELSDRQYAAAYDKRPSASYIRVWDPLIRLIHWTVAFGCVTNLLLVTDGRWLHRAIGYVVAGALVTRIVWGFVGTRHARFTDFVPSPRQLAVYLRDLVRGEEKRYVGHNPAGACMMLLLMTLLAGVSITGWMLGLDAFWGVEWVLSLHEMLAEVIMAFALVHATAAVLMGWRHAENLIWSMITGWKRM